MADFTIQSTDVLLVIDLQTDFTPGGALAVPGGDEIIPAINALSQKFQHVIATRDWHPLGHISFASTHGKQPFTDTVEAAYGTQSLWPDHCVQMTLGAELHRDLHLANLDLILNKGTRPQIDSYSAFLENDHTTPTGLAGYLRERGFHRLFLCGLASDYCVGHSALDGVHMGFECIVLEDLTRGISQSTIATMEEKWLAAGVRALPSGSLKDQ
ncbi:bifunctional nicotinamidase/pyrazinamidase [Terriglobus saanensis]|uniref:nicotinamidase n=1 Tax=Terriglobus saanensis (strain ATCC BAA-1853 / DSM 23119 / SP1PR4) TaxID=401053 RepID=E8V543_TERSS|nr:bifunctional nicotinamidase/pyrazinamidase [Terriglobus saanensis]ADV83730.1 Nicotinamidase [Terriglobus saanensis SP1PR4]